MMMMMHAIPMTNSAVRFSRFNDSVTHFSKRGFNKRLRDERKSRVRSWISQDDFGQEASPEMIDVSRRFQRSHVESSSWI